MGIQHVRAPDRTPSVGPRPSEAPACKEGDTARRCRAALQPAEASGGFCQGLLGM
jgi:hypothetical protein